MNTIFNAAKGRLYREKQKSAAEKLPKDYRELLAKRIAESPYSGGADYPGPYYMVYNHSHIDLGTKELEENKKNSCADLPYNIRCNCDILASFDRSYLVKLAKNLENMGFVTILGEVSLNEPIPNHRSELPVGEVTMEQEQAAGFFWV